jgi:amino acid permease
MYGELSTGAPDSISQIDAAASHVWAFAFMMILMLMFGVGRVAKETKTSVKWKSFLHLWMVAYLVLLAFLMSVTTAMALVLLIDEKGQPRVTFIPPSFLSMTAAVLGVFGFEFLFRKFIIGFGENQLDLATTLQNFVDQAVAATLKKEAGG